jgi:hypothetical protein
MTSYHQQLSSAKNYLCPYGLMNTFTELLRKGVKGRERKEIRGEDSVEIHSRIQILRTATIG